ncbi:MAG: phytoene/squalene synthase family protein [Bacilli bacterium]
MNLYLAYAYWRCERVIKRNSATFYRAFSTIKDKHRRQGVYAVYAFCRYVDDLIDEHRDLKALQNYKAKLDDFVKGYQKSGFRWRALADTRDRFYPDETYFAPFYEMIEGQEFDAHPVRIETMDQLLKYADLVASSVGKMLLPMLAPHAEKDLTPFAIALGRAFQLTNILRDVGEDFRRDRIYLPQSLMHQFHYTVEDLKSQCVNDAFIQLFETIAQVAESYYQEAEKWIPLFPDDIRFSLHASLVLYREILQVIRKKKYQVMHQKLFVSNEEKLAIITQLKTK